MIYNNNSNDNFFSKDIKNDIASYFKASKNIQFLFSTELH